MTGTVYLIHFDTPYKHAKHYLGWSRYLHGRLDHHRRGTGARLLQVVNEAGISWRVVRTWKKQDRNFERRLKNQKNSPRLCPVCASQNGVNKEK
jgi:predicted GIY-YIG superfamily endonuclease